MVPDMLFCFFLYSNDITCRPTRHLGGIKIAQEREHAKKLVHQLILLAMERPGMLEYLFYCFLRFTIL